jgi:tetratricopeptide (TPR) repeat protein
LGEYHQDISDSMNDLAILYDKLGRYAEAEVCFRRALKYIPLLYYSKTIYKPILLRITENNFGKYHPQLAENLQNLAINCHYQDKIQEASECYERSFEIYQKTLGTVHPTVADLLYNHASLYRKSQDFQKWYDKLKEAKEVYEQVHGRFFHAITNFHI